jgi:hypothetical protein
VSHFVIPTASSVTLTTQVVKLEPLGKEGYLPLGFGQSLPLF